MHDLVIKNGKLIDGTGRPAVQADVAVSDGRITEVGRVAGAARQTIDAEGRIVTPGFVDIHTHYDAPGDLGSASRCPRAGTASRPSWPAIAASASRRRRPTATSG